MQKSDIGLIGLAVMGQNLARNISNNGFKISVYNRTSSVTEEFLAEHGSETLVGETDLEAFVQSIKTPRKIGVMVKAGKPVDMVIESLIPLLDKGDTIIDFGNTHFPDTIRREKSLAEQGLHFFGCGVSGGEEGALKGPSMMPGGAREVWDDMEPIFKAICAKDFNGGDCVAYLGPNAAGHYVKMVHNGIEYGVMQMMAEAYELLSTAYDLKPNEIADIFEKYNEGKLQSFLFEISIPILRQKDDLGDGFLIDKILDKAGQKGTGLWTSLEGLVRGQALTVITQAVYARGTSSFKNQRERLAAQYKKPKLKINMPVEDLIQPLEETLYMGMLVAYAQGFDLLARTSDEMDWDLDFAEIARIWEGGCIIRAQILNTLHEAFGNSDERSLWAIPEIAQDLQKSLPESRAVVSFGIQTGTPLFCLGAALSSFEAMTNARTSANFIQAQRDSFGAHTYQRTDRDGTFHTEWGD